MRATAIITGITLALAGVLISTALLIQPNAAQTPVMSLPRRLGPLPNTNAFVEFGVYDLTAPNVASQQPSFAGELTTFRDANAICWYDMFPPAMSLAPGGRGQRFRFSRHQRSLRLNDVRSWMVRMDFGYLWSA